jgi:hypothetical protein
MPEFRQLEIKRVCPKTFFILEAAEYPKVDSVINTINPCGLDAGENYQHQDTQLPVPNYICAKLKYTNGDNNR